MKTASIIAGDSKQNTCSIRSGCQLLLKVLIYPGLQFANGNVNPENM